MLLTLAALAVFAQGPQKCVTVGGNRVCGYECADNGVRAQCTQTPAGVCAKNSTQVMCFDPPLWLAATWGGAVPKPVCETDGTNIACGYDCKREGVKVACASTPSGICTRQYGSITCFDPAPEVYGVFGKSVPAPSCKAQDGQVACGYGCIASNNQVACARTPFGLCAEGGGSPTCFDPDKAVICAKGTSTAKAQCVRQSGSVFCGYACARAGDEVACAKTPDGSCDTSGPGKPVCFDPPMRGGSSACLEAAGAR
ncbi:MAG: hypothetical protein Q8N23_28460 [Archangium sp.]|nr:hypothetical protein [Archangium sp.]MDP3156638.1 hypothetical protein [Archangium sp.]MDP3570579.1 hypothetical protein [Archangium sp.]